MTQSRQTPVIAPAVLLLLAAVSVMGIYISTSQHTGGGEIIMPLDDTYIHFQYARQLSQGQPYRYNPGDPPSSGATSFLYPFVLAPGHALGLTGFDLGYWAIGIGMLALAGSALVVYFFARDQRLPVYVTLSIGLLFVATGVFSWHFMSGMETGLVVLFTLATLYTFHMEHHRTFCISAALLALSRPEGSVMALLAVGVTFLHHMRQRQPHSDTHLLWLGLPVAAAFAQPLLNLSLTGTISASGTQAKSILNTVPSQWNNILQRIADNFARIWIELLTGTNNRYVPVPVVLLSVAGFVRMIREQHTRRTALLVALWMLAVTPAVATLDTAFWHFKRYQVPLMALQYPMAAVGLAWLWQAISVQRYRNTVFAGVITLTAFITLAQAAEFHRLYEVNLNNMVSQPLPMAQWLREHTEEDAVVAVHDVGMMRYIGDRYTLDMVGLTTPQAADYWRNGPGSVAEFLMTYEQPVDYVAAYTTARGLNYLAETSIYGELIRGFSAEYDPADNVALGAEFQGIFQYEVPSDYRALLETVHLEQITEGIVLDVVNVADLRSEAAHVYRWHNNRPLPGFVTEVYEMDYAGCEDDCRVIDGGRLINGYEEFEITAPDNTDAYLVTRVHPFHSGTFDVYVNNQFVATRVIPAIPGRWLDIATLIPSTVFTSERATVRIEPIMASGAYMPYRHVIFLAQDTHTTSLDSSQERLASFQGIGQVDLLSYDIMLMPESKRLMADFVWSTNGEAAGDYKFFLHVYDDPEQSPVAQSDGYVGGSLPIGNWLSGTIEDTITMDLSGLQPGTYQIAIGFYEAQTLERLEPLGVQAGLTHDQLNRRLFLTEIEISG